MNDEKRIAKIFQLIDYQLERLEAIKESYPQNLPIWRDRTIRLLTNFIVHDELTLLSKINSESWDKDKILYREFLISIKTGIEKFPDIYLTLEQDSDEEEAPNPRQSTTKNSTSTSQKVFIVHGHETLAKVEVARFIERLGLEAIILHEQTNEGRTIIEKFEQNASIAGFAIILLTPDDVGYPTGQPDKAHSRARQNVILELGYFCGLLGRKRVCVLYKGDVEVPTDYLGVIYTQFDDIGAWRLELAKEMKQAGLNTDLNRL